MEAACPTFNPKTPWSSTKSSSFLRRRRGNRVETKKKVSTRSTFFGASAALWFVFDVIGPFLCLAWPTLYGSRTASLQQRLQSWSAASSTVDIDVPKRPETISIDQGRVYPGPWRRAQRSCSDGMMTLSMLLESIRMYVPRPSCYTEPTLLLLLLPHHSR
jgi:hypothetical protein